MKNKIPNLKVTFLALFLTLGFAKTNAQQSAYLAQNHEMASQLSVKYGIPASVILAVAFVESGAGTSKNSKLFHNHFGITGKNTVTNSRFKSYESIRESYEAFCQLLARKKFYSAIKGTLNLQTWLSAISKAGYAEDPQDWISKVNYVINKYNLR